MFHHLLVPINGSALSDRLVESSVQAAHRAGAHITFFHAAADFGATSDGALAHDAWPAEFDHLAQAQALTILAKAEATARALQVPCQTSTAVGPRTHDLIHEAALRAGCDVICIASRPGGAVARLLHRSVTARLLEVSTLPVLVAAARTDTRPSDQELASAILRDEHRSLAAVLHALSDTLDRSDVTGQHPDPRLLGAMLHYIETFPEQRHHPKEESHVFARLRQRAPQYTPLMDRLQQEHATGKAQMQQLRAALRELERDPVRGRAGFARLVADFVTAQFAHMALEEQSLMPAAREHLTPEDWHAIRVAFEGNASPVLDADADEPFNHLLGRILGLAQEAAGSAPPTTGHAGHQRSD